MPDDGSRQVAQRLRGKLSAGNKCLRGWPSSLQTGELSSERECAGVPNAKRHTAHSLTN